MSGADRERIRDGYAVRNGVQRAEENYDANRERVRDGAPFKGSNNFGATKRIEKTGEEKQKQNRDKGVRNGAVFAGEKHNQGPTETRRNTEENRQGNDRIDNDYRRIDSYEKIDTYRKRDIDDRYRNEMLHQNVPFTPIGSGVRAGETREDISGKCTIYRYFSLREIMHSIPAQGGFHLL